MSAAEPLAFPSAGAKSFLLAGAEDALDSVLGLGDLAHLTVTNDDPDYGYEVSFPAGSPGVRRANALLRPQLSSCQDASCRKTWSPRYTLRSHFDGVRALAFHPVEPCLVTVSEDHTLKLWNLTKTVPAKK